MDRAQFNPEDHSYEGGRLPSVTQVLVSIGLIDSAYYTEKGKQRGLAVHRICQYYDEGDLDKSSIDPSLQGYFAAYLKFKHDSQIEIGWIETPIKTNLYAGTPDRICVARPRKLIDLKTGAYKAADALQTAAYVNMLKDPLSYSRFCLYLRDSGTYSLREFPKNQYLQDLNVFLSCLNIYNWRKLNGNRID